MSGTDIVLQARTATLAPFNLAFWDVVGDGSILVPKHALTDTTGARIDPATKQGIAALATALGAAPAQTPDVAAVATALAGILKVAMQIGGQPISSSNRVPVEIDADNETVLARDTSLVSLNTAIGTTADAAAPTGSGTLVALLKALRTMLGGTLATSQQPYTTATAITPGTPVTAGRGVFIACTASGTVRLKFANSNTLDVPVNIGPNMIDNIAVVDVVAANTTATVTVAVLN